VNENALREAARQMRAQVEGVLDAAGWPWCSRVSHFLDLLVLAEELELGR
jgi:hypothetical protein